MHYELLQCQTTTETVRNFKWGKIVSFEDFTGKKTEIRASHLLFLKHLDDVHSRVTYYTKLPVISGGKCLSVKESSSGMLTINLPDGTNFSARKGWVKIYEKE